METNTDRTSHDYRGWLASLLLRQPERFLPRLAAAVHQWRMLSRRLRRRLQRKAATRKVAATALGAALVISMAGGAFFAPTAHAATINVDDGLIIMDANDGFCSLREAINNANLNNQFSANPGECESGAVGPDTINLPTNGTFTLLDSDNFTFYSPTGLPVISSEMTIEGNGSTITRDGTAPEFRMMAVNGSGDLTLNDVVISGGHSAEDGGGIYLYDGKLTINDSTITNNYARDDGGGIEVDGTVDASTAVLTINNSQITYNDADDAGGGVAEEEGSSVIISNSSIVNNDAYYGGGIYSDHSTLEISDSTISGNFAGYGAGIYLNDNSTASITNSVISGNEGWNGVGIYIDYSQVDIIGSTISGNDGEEGGGLYIDGDYSDVTIVNTTISDNTVSQRGGGIYFDEGELTLNNVTITANMAEDEGGGIFKYFAEATLTLNRSVVSGNNAGNGAEIYIYNGTGSSDNYNVLGHSGLSDANAFAFFTPGATDVTATSDGSDPTALAGILDTTLADNGGPTLTHNLVLGSPALDMAPDADCAADPTDGVDQRGETRPFDVVGEGNDAPDTNTCDAGAVEYGSAPAATAIYMSAKTSGTTGDGVAFDNSDILMWDGAEWTKVFDGTDAHLDPNNKPKHNINAFFYEEDDIVMSFAQNGRKVNGLPGKVDGMDLVHWDGSAFTLWFDGSDVGLTKKTAEKIDALHLFPGDASPIGASCEQYLLISTQGPGAVPAFGGGSLKFGGEDILGFCMTNYGEATAGFWHLALDGSAVGLPKNSLDSISASGDTIYFTTSKAVVLPGGVSGGHSMVFAYDIGTGEFSGPLFIAADEGLPTKVDGLQVNGALD